MWLSLHSISTSASSQLDLLLRKVLGRWWCAFPNRLLCLHASSCCRYLLRSHFRRVTLTSSSFSSIPPPPPLCPSLLSLSQIFPFATHTMYSHHIDRPRSCEGRWVTMMMTLTHTDKQTQTHRPMDKQTQTHRPMDRQIQTHRPMDRQTQTHRLMDRQTQTHRPMDRKTQTHRPMDRQTQTHRPMDRQTQTHRPMDRQTQTHRPMDRQTQTHRPMDRQTQTHRPMDRQTQTHRHNRTPSQHLNPSPPLGQVVCSHTWHFSYIQLLSDNRPPWLHSVSDSAFLLLALILFSYFSALQKWTTSRRESRVCCPRSFLVGKTTADSPRYFHISSWVLISCWNSEALSRFTSYWKGTMEKLVDVERRWCWGSYQWGWSQGRKEMFYNGKSRGIGYGRMCCSPFLLNPEWIFLAEWWVLTTDKFRQRSMRCGFLLIPSPLLFLVSKEGESCWVKMYAWLLAVKH